MGFSHRQDGEEARALKEGKHLPDRRKCREEADRTLEFCAQTVLAIAALALPAHTRHASRTPSTSSPSSRSRLKFAVF